MESGQTIAGKYRLNQLLGTGGMATVWSATNTFTEREHAIKIMLPAMARTPEAARRFLLEAKASARINHPNIIEVMDVGQAEDGSLFMVMELLSGVSLETALKRQNPPMTVYEFTIIMLDVARALAAAHRSNVIHRDLKPTNIFLHKDRHGIAVPKLLDFGVSKFVEEENQSQLTIAGTVLGSPMYMSPEQAKGESDIDGRTDIFAFGSMLFEALAGYRCYDAPNFNALIVAIATKPPKDIDDAAPNMPDSLRALIKDCLQVEKSKRIPTFEDLVDRLGLAVPYLEELSTRLPSPKQSGPVIDPDATNALPAMVRASDRAPAIGKNATKGSKSDRNGAGKSAAPAMLFDDVAGAAMYATSPGGRILNDLSSGDLETTTGTLESYAPRPSAPRPSVRVALKALPVPVLAAIGAGIVLAAVAFIWLIVVASRKPVAVVAKEVQPVRTAATAIDSAQAPKVTELDEPPSINVDSLPVVHNGSTAGLAKGSGKLLVTASPWCTLFVDGNSKGPTPVSVEIAAGPHQLRCDPPKGEPKIANVGITDGATARYKFSFE
ncbi:MAG: serine/threonine-protein kinase [Polyangiaceae bacterium]